jgi:hypothetical protein
MAEFGDSWRQQDRRAPAMAATSNTGTPPPRLPHPSTISPRGSADRLIRAEASTAPRRQLLPPSRGDYLAPPYYRCVLLLYEHNKLVFISLIQRVRVISMIQRTMSTC